MRESFILEYATKKGQIPTGISQVDVYPEDLPGHRRQLILFTKPWDFKGVSHDEYPAAALKELRSRVKLAFNPPLIMFGWIPSTPNPFTGLNDLSAKYSGITLREVRLRADYNGNYDNEGWSIHTLLPSAAETIILIISQLGWSRIPLIDQIRDDYFEDLLD